ncbi:ATP-binding cassette transporter [Clonorchis sinensis]|uniref:ATP-binding cassette transporter n=1 Tax=Clonorchis sinensis TaxID=79923 RepID=G7YXF7_CLOSI|nr:ATP-binding cassette transporter [Clonorchis sinensis]
MSKLEPRTPDMRDDSATTVSAHDGHAPESDVHSFWEITTSSYSAGSLACNTTAPGAPKQWISDRTVTLLKSRRNIPAGPEHNLTRRIIRREVKLSVRTNRQVWWKRKAKENEEVQKAENGLRLFPLIRATRSRKPPVK